jgi:hypothetical protein
LGDVLEGEDIYYIWQYTCESDGWEDTCEQDGSENELHIYGYVGV